MQPRLRNIVLMVHHRHCVGAHPGLSFPDMQGIGHTCLITKLRHSAGLHNEMHDVYTCPPTPHFAHMCRTYALAAHAFIHTIISCI